MPNESKPVELPVPSPTSKAAAAAVSVTNGADVQALFADVTQMTPWDEEAKKAERTFIESKIEMIHKDSKLTEAEKERAIEELRRAL